MIKDIAQSLQELFPQTDLFLILRIVFIVALSLIIYRLLSSIINKTARSVRIQPNLIREILNFLRITVGGLAFISILGTLGIDITGLIAGVGIGALAVGFAAQAQISNLISGLFPIFERTFVMGDIIQVESTTGRVVQIGFKATQIETVEGNIIVIPNSSLASSQIANLTTRKNEMTLAIDEAVDIYSDAGRPRCYSSKP